jgi:hypothetical protein
MLTEIVLNANIMRSLSGLGESITSRLFRSSGWSIPDDTDTGVSFGEAVDGGFGSLPPRQRSGNLRGYPPHLPSHRRRPHEHLRPV